MCLKYSTLRIRVPYTVHVWLFNEKFSDTCVTPHDTTWHHCVYTVWRRGIVIDADERGRDHGYRRNGLELSSKHSLKTSDWLEAVDRNVIVECTNRSNSKYIVQIVLFVLSVSNSNRNNKRITKRGQDVRLSEHA